MDGRDLIRCLETERVCNVNVFCVSREQAAIYNTSRHLDANFNRASFAAALQKQFCTKFQQVILDWFWIPPGWDDSHWNRSFFSQTLPALAKEQVLEVGGQVILPFCFHCFKEVIGSLDSLREFYDISFLHKDELELITLWKGTRSIDSEAMQHALGKRIDQEDVYCTFNSRHLQNMNESFVSKHRLLEIAQTIEDFATVRFLVLHLIDNDGNSSKRGMLHCRRKKPSSQLHTVQRPTQVTPCIATGRSEEPSPTRRVSTRSRTLVPTDNRRQTRGYDPDRATDIPTKKRGKSPSTNSIVDVSTEKKGSSYSYPIHAEGGTIPSSLVSPVHPIRRSPRHQKSKRQRVGNQAKRKLFN